MCAYQGGWKGIEFGMAREGCREDVGGGTPPDQPGGVRERCKLSHWGPGLCPRSQRFL